MSASILAAAFVSAVGVLLLADLFLEARQRARRARAYFARREAGVPSRRFP
jgi:hypothetical protein